MKEIKLSNTDKVAIVDDEDYALVMSHGPFWCAVHRLDKTITGVICRSQITGENIYMHKLLLGLNKFSSLQGDHKDNNPLNNQRYNLRTATQAQNSQNRRKSRFGSSRFKGVSWTKNVAKWVSQIRKDGKLYNLGYYISEEEAARKYDEKAKELFGEFANVNFPKPASS